MRQGKIDTNNVDPRIRYLLLSLLVCTNVSYGLLLPLCREPDEDGNVFYGPSSVVIIEVLKAVVATIGLLSKHFFPLRKLKYQSHHNLLLASATDSITGKERHPFDNKTDLQERGYDEEKNSELELGGNIENQNLIYAVASKESSEASVLLQTFSHAWADIYNVSVLRLVFPAVLYTIQNNLQIFSAGFLSPAEFQVLSQLKLITTALFSVCILRKVLIRQHWLCIGTLCVGVIIVQGAGAQIKKEETLNMTLLIHSLWSLGVPLMISACCCAGLAGVLSESLLKGKRICFWTINIYLALFSLVPSLLPIIVDTMVRGQFDPLRYFNKLVWAMIINNVIGGMLVSLVIKYTDSILKGFAVSIALIVTILASSLITGRAITTLQISGGLLVSVSTYFYGMISS